MADARKEAYTYYKKMDERCPNVARYSRNLTMLHLDDQLDPCYHRELPLTQIQKILLRKNKSNVLLTGAAGCGKTALAEGLAAIIAERKVAHRARCAQAIREHRSTLRKWEKLHGKEQDCQSTPDSDPYPEYVEPPKPPLCDCVIYDLSLNALISGTKYRGEFEERLQDILIECRKAPNVILFIDEIHQISKLGATEGSFGAGQILKPALARNDLRVIGATTTEEREYITGDKALARRFCEVEVTQLTGNAAKETTENLLRDYCSFHHITTDVSAADLLAQVQYFMPHTVFPDNIINVVDETLAGAVFDGLTSVKMEHFYAVLSRLTGKVILCSEVGRSA